MGQDVELISSSGCLDAQFDVPHPDTPWDCHRTAAPLTPKTTTPGRIYGSPDWQSQTGRVWVMDTAPVSLRVMGPRQQNHRFVRQVES